MTITSAPLNNAQQISEKLEALKTALQTASPGYESLLHTIHVALSKDEAITYLLSPEEIGVLCAGLSKKKGVVITASTAKGKTAGGKKLSELKVGTDL